MDVAVTGELQSHGGLCLHAGSDTARFGGSAALTSKHVLQSLGMAQTSPVFLRQMTLTSGACRSRWDTGKESKQPVSEPLNALVQAQP